MATKFFFCKHCGNVVVKMVDSGVTPYCCGDEMVELTPNVMDGVGEKHLPVIEKIDDCTVRVKVGSVLHPMLPEHHICFIYLETKNGGQLRQLDASCPPEAVFCTCKDEITAVYEFCNVHGLWMTAVNADDLKKECCTTSEKGACCSTADNDSNSGSAEKGACCVSNRREKRFFGRCK